MALFRKSKGILVATILILSSLIVSLNSGVGTENPENVSQDNSIARSLPRSNGGINWSEIEVISEPVYGQDFNVVYSAYPKIAVENDKIYVVWDDANDTNGAGNERDIFYRYFDGSKWGDIQVISEPVPGQNFNIGWSYAPSIAVENGKIYVVWHDTNDTNGAGVDSDIFYRSNLTGLGWEPVQVISEPVLDQNINTGISQFFPKITVENDKIYVIWYDTTNLNGAGTDQDIFFRCNLTGTNWEDIQVISEPEPGKDYNTKAVDQYDIAVENGKIYVVWADLNETYNSGVDKDIFYRCNLTGLAWNDIEVISEPVPGQDRNIGNSWRPSIDVNNDKIYIVWEDTNNTIGGGTDQDIFFRCNLNSNSWEDIQVISEPEPGNDYNLGVSSWPSISVENDNIFIVWRDNNQTNGAGGDSDIFYIANFSVSEWEPVQVISEPILGQNNNTLGSNYPNIAVENSNIFVVWSDYNNTNGAGTDGEIFFRSAYSPLGLRFPKVTPTSGNTSTYFNFTVQYFHLKNTAPTKIIVNISGTEYPLLEVDPLDTNHIDGKDYFLNNTHLDIGVHKYQFYSSDGTNSRLTSFINKPIVYNTAPNVTTEDIITTLEYEYYNVSYEYDDIDLANVGQLGTWNYSTNASWLNFDNVTATLNGTPTNNDVGSYWINISINDTMELDWTNFTLTVLDVNDNPIIVTIDVEITYEDELYEVDYNATDVDSLVSYQIWSLDTNATSWLDIESITGIISGTPNNDEVGEYWVNVSVDDGDSGFAFTNYTLIVLNVNDRPEITTVDVTTTNSNILYTVDYNATDIDSPLSQLSWSLTTNATWLDIDATTGVLSGTPTDADAGWFNVNVTVNDGDGSQDWQDFILTVIYSGGIINQPPLITTTDVVSATVNEMYYVDYDATDDRTSLDLLTWQLNTDASWLSLATSTGILSGTPAIGDVGAYWVNVSVGDGEGGFDSHNFTLTVYSEANNPPEITTEDDINAVVGELYSVDYEANDDRTPVGYLQWSLKTNASDWLGIDKVTGVLSGTPELEDVRSYWVEVTVFDGEDGWDFTNFTLYVTTEPITDFKPELSNPSMTPATGDTNTEFTFSVDYNHPNGDPPDSIQVLIDDVGYDMTSINGNYEYRTKLSEGDHTYYFTTKLGDFTVNTDTYNTGYITKAEGQPEDGDGDGDDSNTMFYALIGIIIIIIVVLILLFIFLKRKKGEEEEPPVEEAQPPPPEEVSPEVPPEQVPTPEAPPSEQPPPPEVPPEEVPVPETPSPKQPQVPPEQPPTPEVTPQVPQPQVEPAHVPMPQVEEQPQPLPEPQVEQPQVEVQEPAVVEQPEEPQQQPVPTIKTQPTIEENNV